MWLCDKMGNGIKHLLIFLFGFWWLFFMAMFFLLLCPFHLYRKLVAIYARRARKDLGKLVSAQSNILAMDDHQGHPECNVVIWFCLKGEMTVKEFQREFIQKILDIRNAQGDLVYPEFRQYYKYSLGYLFWKWDDNFSINNHIKYCRDYDHLPSVTREDVVPLNEKLLQQPWPLAQSPWQFLIIPNYVGEEDTNENGPDKDKNTLILFHLHHGFGDGYTFLKMVLYHMWGQDKWAQIARPKFLQDRRSIWVQVAKILYLPVKVMYDFSRQSLNYDRTVWHLPQSKFARKWGIARTTKIPITFIKDIKNSYGVSFTAVMAAGISGGFRKHFVSQGYPIPANMHVLWPFPLPDHPDDKLRNHLTGCMTGLPIGKATPEERVKHCQAEFEYMKTSTLPLVNWGMSVFSGALPTFLRVINRNYHAAGIISNMPGNEEPIYIFGKEVVEFTYNAASLHGRTGFLFTILSYGKYVSIDVAIDKALLPHENSAQEIVDAVREEFNVMWKSQNNLP